MDKLKPLLLYSSLILFLLFVSSCSKGTGCPINDPATVGASTSKKNKLSTKRGKSNLFPKKMRKRN